MLLVLVVCIPYSLSNKSRTFLPLTPTSVEPSEMQTWYEKARFYCNASFFICWWIMVIQSCLYRIMKLDNWLGVSSSPLMFLFSFVDFAAQSYQMWFWKKQDLAFRYLYQLSPLFGVLRWFESFDWSYAFPKVYYFSIFNIFHDFMQRLFFLNGEQDLSAFLLVDLGIIKYPNYNCIISKQIFSSRNDFLAYEEVWYFYFGCY